MLKKRYILKAETSNIENYDPNLDIALGDIIYQKDRKGDKFDFELCFIFDGFVENFKFNSIINTFLHDIVDKENFFHIIYKSVDFKTHVKDFMRNVYYTASTKNYDDKNLCMMDAFTYVGKSTFSFKFFLPTTIMTDSKQEEFLHLGADYMCGILFVKDMFEYVLPYLYAELQEHDLLQSKEHKNMMNYKMGLH